MAKGFSEVPYLFMRWYEKLNTEKKRKTVRRIVGRLQIGIQSDRAV